jgi:hypothetical protein
LRGSDGRYISPRKAPALLTEEQRIAATSALLAERMVAELERVLIAEKPVKSSRTPGPKRGLAIIRAAEQREREARRQRVLAAEALELEQYAKPKRGSTAAALKGWETRRAKAAELKRLTARIQQARARALAAPRGEGGRFATPKQGAAYARERLKAKKAVEVAARKRMREAAALKGWKTISAKAKKLLDAYGPGPSRHLRAIFTDHTRWKSAGWYSYPDGQQEGQIIIAAGLNSRLRDRLLALAEVLEDDMRHEPVWVEVGFLHVGLGKDDYKKFGGMDCATLYPRKAEYIGAIFSDMRTLGDDLIGAGADIKQAVVRVHYGDRPKGLGS